MNWKNIGNWKNWKSYSWRLDGTTQKRRFPRTANPQQTQSAMML
jgi:hypothetical protein